MAPGLMPRQLDNELGKFLQTKIEDLGIQVHLAKRTQSLETIGHANKFRFPIQIALLRRLVNFAFRHEKTL